MSTRRLVTLQPPQILQFVQNDILVKCSLIEYQFDSIITFSIDLESTRGIRTVVCHPERNARAGFLSSPSIREDYGEGEAYPSNRELPRS